MMQLNRKKISLCLGSVVLLQSLVAGAVSIRFPENELATESVLPVFRSKDVVKDRNVATTSRIEVSGFAGSAMNEAFYDTVAFGGSISYHINEEHAVELFYSALSTSVSKFEDTLNQDLAAENQAPYDFERAPSIKSFFLASWEYIPLYGKISITKQTVWNLNTYVTLGLGLTDTGDGSSITGSFGLGQKIFFSSNWGLKIDLKTLYYTAPNPLSNPRQLQGTSTSGFDEEGRFNTLLTAGLIYLFPSL